MIVFMYKGLPVALPDRQSGLSVMYGKAGFCF